MIRSSGLRGLLWHDIVNALYKKFIYIHLTRGFQDVAMILELLTALVLVSHALALHLHRTWLDASDSAPPNAVPSASSAARAEIGQIDVERSDPIGGEILIAAANRKGFRSPQRQRASAAGRGS
jgi:hypothetical protein